MLSRALPVLREHIKRVKLPYELSRPLCGSCLELEGCADARLPDAFVLVNLLEKAGEV